MVRIMSFVAGLAITTRASVYVRTPGAVEHHRRTGTAVIRRKADLQTILLLPQRRTGTRPAVLRHAQHHTQRAGVEDEALAASVGVDGGLAGPAVIVALNNDGRGQGVDQFADAGEGLAGCGLRGEEAGNVGRVVGEQDQAVTRHQHSPGLMLDGVADGAQLGLAFEGDGDRLIAVDEKGEELTGDHIMAICAKDYLARGQLKHNLVIATVMSNFGFHAAMKKLGIEVGIAPVGDRYVLEMMRQRDAVLGGEASGHMIFHDHHSTGDGIISALQLLAAMCTSKQPLSELAQVMHFAPQKLVNINVKQKPPVESVPELQAAIRVAEDELGEAGRVLVRYSGTQAMCRVMVEGPTEEMTGRLCQSLAETVKKCLA